MTTLASKRPPRLQGRKEGGYIYYGKRVVFLEHERDGELYDRDRLERIAANMNSRIERGIWCPAIVGHTSKYNKESDHGVVGYFGPYEVIDGVGPDGEAGIVAGQWSREEYPLVAEEYPRVSAEAWPGEDIIDPISLLGGTTPYFDMPVLEADMVPYCKPPQNPKTEDRRTGKSHHYEATVATGSNTSIPKMIGDEDDDPEKYSLTGDGQAQLIQALKPMIQQIVTESVAEALNISDVGNTDESIGEEDLVEAGVADPTTDLDAGGETDGLTAAGKADMETEDIKTSTGPDSMDESADFRKQYLRDKFTKLAALDDGVEQCVQYMKTLDEDDKAALALVLEEGTENESEKALYAKAEACLKDKKPEAEEGEEDEEAGTEGDEGSKQKYARELDEAKTKYARARDERDEYKQKYERVQAELDGERAKAREAEKKARYSKRLAELKELSSEYVLNPESEMEDAVDMTDAQFERYVSKIKTNYQRVPNGGALGHLAVDPERKSDDEKQARYHKRTQEVASEIVNKGHHRDYQVIYQRVVESDGKVTADELLKA